MKKKYISWLVFGLSAALVVACGSSDTGAEESRSDPGAKPGPRPHAARHQSAQRVPSGSPPIPTWCIRVAKVRRSAAAYFVELATQQKLVALSKAEEGAPGSGDIAFVLAGEGDAATKDRRRRLFARHREPIASPSPRTRHRDSSMARSRSGSSSPRSRCRVCPSSMPALKIDDAPRFAWRGLMLDSARHYQSPEYIKQFIDWMALHKLNVLHWHLTDDQAWRLEIKKYPKLTSVGAWRVPAGAGGRAPTSIPATGKPRLYGGFYTQDQVRDIVAYAASAAHHRRARDRDAGPRDRGDRRLSASSASPASRRRPCPRTGASSRRCSTSRTRRSRSSRTCSPK